jgi:hypothetical protein
MEFSAKKVARTKTYCPRLKITQRKFTQSGANPTVVIYNASAVKIHNATSSLVRFENKNILFYHEKCFSILQRWHGSCKIKSRRIGSLSPVLTKIKLCFELCKARPKLARFRKMKKIASTT